MGSIISFDRKRRENALAFRPDPMSAAAAFAEDVRSRFLFCPAFGWMMYDGKRWVPDETVRIDEALRVFVRGSLAMAEAVDNTAHIQLFKSLHDRRKREFMLRDAQSMLAVPTDALDRGNVLNLQNGTFDLNTRELRPHAPADLLTKCANAAYDPAAAVSREWTQFLFDITCNDEGLAKLLRRMAGYCLAPSTRFEKAFILFGATTRNGKSTFLETVAHMMGNYATTARPDLLAMKQGNGGGAPSEDVARLHGSRLVAMAEADRGMRLDAALLKMLTGGDTVTARFLHRNSFEFRPQFKLILNSNHLPSVSDDTVFSSGRLVVIPFRRHFAASEQKRGLKERFRDPEILTGVLHWALAGLEELDTPGVFDDRLPAAAQDAVSDYRQESDTIGLFLTECTRESKGTRTKTSVLYAAYCEWAAQNGLRAFSCRTFVGELRRKCEVVRDSIGNCTKDIALN